MKNYLPVLLLLALPGCGPRYKKESVVQEQIQTSKETKRVSGPLSASAKEVGWTEEDYK